MRQYFSKPYERSGGSVNNKLDLSNHATKSDVKGSTGVKTSKLAAKSDLPSLRTKVDQLVNIPRIFNNLKTNVDE